MLFFQSLFAGAAFAAAAMALEINDFPRTVEAGKTYTITYSPADDTATTFILRQGKNEDLSTVETLTASAINGEFKWTVSDDFPNASDYALEVKQGDLVNYIGPIGLSGSDATSAVPSSSAKPSSTAAAPSSTAAPSATTVSTVIVPTTAAASASVSSSVSSNGTVTSATLTRTRTTTLPTGVPTTTGANVPESTGAASTLGRPIALLLGAFAAIAYLN